MFDVVIAHQRKNNGRKAISIVEMSFVKRQAIPSTLPCILFGLPDRLAQNFYLREGFFR
jgi:hypothetical protein